MNQFDKMLLIAAVLFSVTLGSETASAQIAYIDPGTTSVVFGAVGYIIAGAAAVLAIIFHPVKVLYRKLFKKDADDTADAQAKASTTDEPK
jgi:hypothetical protein